MAQTAHTSQFGTKVWDARRVDLPVDGQSTAQPNESRCRQGCDLEPHRGSTSVNVMPSACRGGVVQRVARPTIRVVRSPRVLSALFICSSALQVRQSVRPLG